MDSFDSKILCKQKCFALDCFSVYDKYLNEIFTLYRLA